MSLARVLDLCDACAAAVSAAWVPTGDDAVARVYAPDVGLTQDNPDTLVRGRKVYLFPGAYASPLLDRGSLLRRYTVAWLVVERYADGAGFPPDAWLDDRVAFVEQTVFNVLRDPTLVLTGAVVSGVQPDPEAEPAVDPVYDLDLLIENHTFWSQGTLTYIEAVDTTGN